MCLNLNCTILVNSSAQTAGQIVNVRYKSKYWAVSDMARCDGRRWWLFTVYWFRKLFFCYTMSQYAYFSLICATTKWLSITYPTQIDNSLFENALLLGYVARVVLLSSVTVYTNICSWLLYPNVKLCRWVYFNSDVLFVDHSTDYNQANSWPTLFIFLNFQEGMFIICLSTGAHLGHARYIMVRFEGQVTVPTVANLHTKAE